MNRIVKSSPQSVDYLPTSPSEKGGSRCREGGGKVSPGVISQMNPGPYRPLCVGGPLVGGVNEPPLARGEF